jgi:hypothetical protein
VLRHRAIVTLLYSLKAIFALDVAAACSGNLLCCPIHAIEVNLKETGCDI